MVFDLCQSLWPGCPGPWTCGSMSKISFLVIPRKIMCCRSGIQRPGFESQKYHELLWEPGHVPSGSEPQFPSPCWGKSVDVGGQELWSVHRWTASCCSSGITVDVWMLLGPRAIARWVSQPLEDHEYQDHPGLSDHSQHHHGTEMACTEWVFSMCLLQECIGLSCGQQRPEKQWFVQDRSFSLCSYIVGLTKMSMP